MYEAPIITETYQPDFVLFRDISGHAHRAEHPVIIGDLSGADASQKIKVGLDGDIEEMSFKDYLFILGIDYDLYLKELASPKNDGIKTNDLLHDLHQRSIDQRIKQALQMHKGVESDQYQQETAKNDSQLFVKLFRDLGIDGVDAESAMPQADYFNEIDEFVIFDKQAYETQGDESGRKIYIGIQRSFSSKSLREPVTFIPEETSRGLVVKIILHESLDSYQDQTGVRLFQKLLETRAQKARQAGLSPLAYAKVHPDTQGLPKVSEVLPGGQAEHIKRVVKVLREIKNQYQNLLDDPQKLAGLSPHWQKRLRENFASLPIQEIIDELTKK